MNTPDNSEQESQDISFQAEFPEKKAYPKEIQELLVDSAGTLDKIDAFLKRREGETPEQLYQRIDELRRAHKAAGANFYRFIQVEGNGTWYYHVPLNRKGGLSKYVQIKPFAAPPEWTTHAPRLAPYDRIQPDPLPPTGPSVVGIFGGRGRRQGTELFEHEIKRVFGESDE